MTLQSRQIAFNAGEWSQRLHYRSDLEKYQHAARDLTNFIPLVHGGIYRRPGTDYITEAHDGNSAVRVVGYNFNVTTAYQLEFGASYLRILRNGAVVQYTAAPQWVLKVAPSNWVNGLSYVVGDWVKNVGGGRTAYTECSLAHVASDGGTPGVNDGPGDNEPCVGEDGKLVWKSYPVDEIHGNASGSKDWFHYDQAYRVNQFVSNNGTTYRAIRASLGFADSEPGVGVNWQTVWEATTEMVLETDYLATEIFDIQIVTVNDLLYLVHPNHPVMKMQRDTATNFSIAPVRYTSAHFPPLLDENTDAAVTVAPSAVSGAARITTSGDVFDPLHLGGHMAIRAIRPSTVDIISMVPGPVVSTPERLVSSGFSLDASFPGWHGAVDVQRKDKGSGEWVQSKVYYGLGDRTLAITGTPPDKNTYMRSTWYPSGAGSAGLLAFTVDESEELGYGQIIDVLSSSNAIVEVLKPYESTAATTQFQLGAFNDFDGHPNAATLHDQRLILGGNANYAQRFFGSVTGDWENFEKGVDDDSAIDFTLGASEYNGIQWFMSQETLLIGTAGGEWTAAGGGAEDAITPTNILVRRVGNEGSAHIVPVAAGDITLFVSRLGRKLVELVYAFEKQGYVSPDLSELSEHLTESGIKQIAFQQQRERIVWLVTNDGMLLGMTYKREQQVVAWFQVATDGTVESVCTSYTSGSDTVNQSTYDLISSEDEIHMVVRRVIGGVPKRFIERFHPGWTQSSAPGWGLEDGIYTDSSLNLSHYHPITDISNASTGVVTVSGGIGDWSSTGRVHFRDQMGGMTELENQSFTARLLSSSSFSIHDLDNQPVDTQTYGAFLGVVGGSTGWAWQEVNNSSGLSHLEGETLDVVGDGAYMGQATVSGGAIVFPASGYASKVSAGLPYTANVTLMPLDVALQNGTSQGKLKKIHRLAVNVLASVGFEAGYGTSFDKVSFQDLDNPLGEAVPLFTGWRDDISFPGGHTKDGDVSIRQVEPLPLTIRSLIVKYAIEQED